jgi:hypothetical protein
MSLPLYLRVRLLVTLLPIAAVLVDTGSLPAQKLDSAVVARVRLDGLVLPFAFYSKGTWTPFEFDGSKGIGSVVSRLPDQWHVTPFTGKASVATAVSVVGILDDDMGYDGWGVTTDLAPRKRARPLYTYPPIERIGIATSVPLRVQSFASVSPGSPAYGRVHARLLSAFDSAATQARTQLPAPHKPLSPTPALRLELRALSSPEGTHTLYEIDARRRFSPYEPAGELVYFGWAIYDGTEVTLVSRVTLIDTDRGTDRPQGGAALLIDNELYVVGAIWGYESETPVIWRWSKSTLTQVFIGPH